MRLMIGHKIDDNCVFLWDLEHGHLIGSLEGRTATMELSWQRALSIVSLNFGVFEVSEDLSTFRTALTLDNYKDNYLLRINYLI